MDLVSIVTSANNCRGETLERQWYRQKGRKGTEKQWGKIVVDKLNSCFLLVKLSS